MKMSSESLDRFQDEEEIRKKLLFSGAIRLTPNTEGPLPDSFQQVVNGGKVIVVGTDGKIVIGRSMVARPSERISISNVVRAKSHSRRKK